MILQFQMPFQSEGVEEMQIDKKGFMDEAADEKSIEDLQKNYPTTAKLLIANLGLTHLIQANHQADKKNQKRGEKQ